MDGLLKDTCQLFVELLYLGEINNEDGYYM